MCEICDGTTLEEALETGRGRRFASETHVHLDAVDPEVWDDSETFNQWWNYYGWRGGGVDEPSALEVRLCGPPPWFADEMEAHRPNRAARRAAARRRHLRVQR